MYNIHLPLGDSVLAGIITTLVLSIAILIVIIGFYVVFINLHINIKKINSLNPNHNIKQKKHLLIEQLQKDKQNDYKTLNKIIKLLELQTEKNYNLDKVLSHYSLTEQQKKTIKKHIYQDSKINSKQIKAIKNSIIQ